MKWKMIGGPLDGEEHDDGNGPWTMRPGDMLMHREVEGVTHCYQSAEVKGQAVLAYRQNGPEFKEGT